MKEIKNKQMSKSAGVNIPRGGSGKMMHEQKTGTQKPGVSGVSKGASNKTFGGKVGGSGKMFGKQSAEAAKPGQSGKGGSGGSGGGGGKKRGYGGDANGNAY